jgi:uncharacterized membrane protein
MASQEETKMIQQYVSAVFDTRQEAEEAVSQLRLAGIDDSAMSLIAVHDGEHVATDGAGHDDELDGDKGFLGKAAAGAGMGAVLGVVALSLPGVGPAIAAGAVASGAFGTAAVTGAAAGLAAGSLASVFSDRGVDDVDADYYERHMQEGGVFLSVNTSDAPLEATSAQEILYRCGGHSTARARTPSAAI